MTSTDSRCISTVHIHLNGSFKTQDGSVGTVVSTPELSEINAFLGILSETVKPSNDFDRALVGIAKRWKDTNGSVLEIRTSIEDGMLKHTFEILQSKPLSKEEAKILLEENGWTLDSWNPLKIRNAIGNTATGEAASLVMENWR